MSKLVDTEEAKVKETEVNQDNIQDIDLAPIKRQRFRINGDNSKIIELNLSDLGIVNRLKETYPKLEKLSAKAATGLSVEEGEDDEAQFNKLADFLKDIDKQMREYVDYIFDANVSAACASDGSMYDPLNGKFRFEHILEKISSLYESNLEAEFKKMQANVSKHTRKYTKK